MAKLFFPVDSLREENEKGRFIALLELVYRKAPDAVGIDCPSQQEAQALRRKFYRLRQSLAEVDKKRAQDVEISVSKTRLTLVDKTAWIKSISSEIIQNDPSSQGPVS